MVEDVHQGVQSAVAPTDDTHPLRVQKVTVFEGEVPSRESVLDFEASVVDSPVETPTITRASPVLGSHYRVSLLQQLSEDIGVSRPEVGVHSAVRKNDERLFPTPVQVTGNKNIGPQPQWIVSTLGGGVGLIAPGRAREGDQLDLSQVAEPLEKHHVVNLTREGVDSVAEALDMILECLLEIRVGRLGRGPGTGQQQGQQQDKTVWNRSSAASTAGGSGQRATSGHRKLLLVVGCAILQTVITRRWP